MEVMTEGLEGMCCTHVEVRVTKGCKPRSREIYSGQCEPNTAAEASSDEGTPKLATNAGVARMETLPPPARLRVGLRSRPVRVYMYPLGWGTYLYEYAAVGCRSPAVQPGRAPVRAAVVALERVTQRVTHGCVAGCDSALYYML